MSTAKKGDVVHVHYTGTLNDGSTFDSSEGRDALEFTVGSGQVIPGFDNAIEGMGVGEEKTVKIPVDEAYGPRHDEMMLDVERTQLPSDMEPEVGMMLQVTTEQGQVAHMTIAEIGETEIKLDGNHPLAGQDLTFALKLEKIG
ncbi:MAG: FKBP-type peptidyl-prolyl cis-trans isomerase [Desulfovibrio sp.]